MSSNNNNNSNNNNRLKRPDVQVRDRKLDVLRTQLKKIDAEIDAVKKEIDGVSLPQRDADEKQKTMDNLKTIMKDQSDLKKQRNDIFKDIERLNASIKKKNLDISNNYNTKKNARYNSSSEIKQRITEIDDMIESGELPLVEERKLVKELQSLNKLNKDLALVEPIKKSIEQDRAKITELKAKLNSDYNPKELSNKFDENQKKLNNIQQGSKSVYDKRQVLFNKRSLLYKKKDDIRAGIRQIQNDFDAEFRSFRAKLEKERLRREEDQKLAKLIELRDNQLDVLKEKLTHAKTPAFSTEIDAIENALEILDPTYTKPKKSLFNDNSANDATINKINNLTPVNNGDLVPMKSGKDDSFSRVPQSKSKKHKKKGANTTQAPSGTQFFLEPTMIALLAELDVTVPTSKDEAATTIEQLKKKNEEFLEKQDEQTEINIKVVETEIAKLDLAFKQKEEEIKAELAKKRAAEQAEKEQQQKAETEATATEN